MLNGCNAGAVFIGQRGAQLHFGDMITAGRDVGFKAGIGSPKPNAGIHCGGFHHHARTRTGMNADSGANHCGIQCRLILYFSQAYSPCRAA